MSGAPFKKLPASPSVSGSSVPVAERGGEEVNVGFSDFGASSGNQLRDPRARRRAGNDRKFSHGNEFHMGPFDQPEVAYTVPEILEPAKFKQLLATAEEEVPELIPFLAMAGFAGLRRSELVREYAKEEVLRWEDINWQKQLITVRHEVAKQTSRKMGNRRLIPMEAALLYWLGPYRKEEGLQQKGSHRPGGRILWSAHRKGITRLSDLWA
jgi:integrase